MNYNGYLKTRRLKTKSDIINYDYSFYSGIDVINFYFQQIIMKIVLNVILTLFLIKAKEVLLRANYP